MPEIASAAVQCPLCKAKWESLEQFLADADVQLVGYQLHFREQTGGLFLFNHMQCKTTLAVPAEGFLPLCHGPIFTECRSHGQTCPEYCLREGETPPNYCDCQFVKEIVDLISNWPKQI